MLKNASPNFLPRRLMSRNSAAWCKRMRGSNFSLRIVESAFRASLRAKALAALRATARERQTAAPGLQASAKAVSAGAVQIAGIESTFHGKTRAKTVV